MTLAQLEALGLSGRAVRHRVAAGRLTRLHRGVYAVGSPSVVGRWMAAVLACGPSAVLSHRSAAALWDLRRDRGRSIDLAVRSRAGRTRSGIVVHHGARLSADDVTSREGIPCTTLPRTLLDLAAVVDRHALERAIDRAEQLRAFDLGALTATLARNGGARGRPLLAAVLADYGGGGVTQSQAEERFLALVADAAIPPPQVNAWIPLRGGGYRPDFLWPDARLIVEIDGRSYHSTRRAFLHDRRRDRRLALAGFETRRYAAAELFTAPKQVVGELRRFLRRARSSA